MARSHGWAGDAPTSDEEAINRILDAADALGATGHTAIRIADVARDLRVTRQTVYRYFPGTEALLVATAMRSADGFLARLATHLHGYTHPVSALVEGMAFAAEILGQDPRFAILLTRHSHGDRAVSLTSEAARTFSRAMLHRIEIDWNAYGFGDSELDELAEFSLRILHSLLIDPGDRAHDPVALRKFLARWLAPAIAYPQLTRTMEALPVPAATTPDRRRRGAAS